MSKWLNKTPIYKLMSFISLNWVKSLLDQQKLRSFVLVTKDIISVRTYFKRESKVPGLKY